MIALLTSLAWATCPEGESGPAADAACADEARINEAILARLQAEDAAAELAAAAADAQQTSLTSAQRDRVAASKLEKRLSILGPAPDGLVALTADVAIGGPADWTVAYHAALRHRGLSVGAALSMQFRTWGTSRFDFDSVEAGAYGFGPVIGLRARGIGGPGLVWAWLPVTEPTIPTPDGELPLEQMTQLDVGWRLIGKQGGVYVEPRLGVSAIEVAPGGWTAFARPALAIGLTALAGG